MNEQTFIGLDLHQKTSTFVVKNKEGEKIDEKMMPTDKETIGSYLAPYAGASLVLEPVSQWYCYADFIESLGLRVVIANPNKVKAIASARIKTDSIDANVLSDLLRANLMPESYHTPKAVRDWKAVVRLRMSLVRLRVQVKNKMHAILWREGIRTAAPLFSVKGQRWLAAQMLPEPAATAMGTYQSLLGTLDGHIREADRMVVQAAQEDAATQLVATVPGFSHLSALTVMAEVGDITRFPSAKKLMGYAGLVPSTYASGGKVRHGHIIKQGSSWLRWIFIEAAHHQLLCRRKKGLGSYYERLRARKGSKVAAVATARKLCAVIWRILTDKRPFISPEAWDNRRAHPGVIAV